MIHPSTTALDGVYQCAALSADLGRLCVSAGGHLPVRAAAAAVPHAAAARGAAPAGGLAQSRLVADASPAGARRQPGPQSAAPGRRLGPHAATRVRGERPPVAANITLLIRFMQ